jgi:hypothetical protein
VNGATSDAAGLLRRLRAGGGGLVGAEALAAADADLGRERAGTAAGLWSVMEAAAAGDMRAADSLLRRLWPERRGRSLRLDVPAVEAAGTCPPRSARSSASWLLAR